MTVEVWVTEGGLWQYSIWGRDGKQKVCEPDLKRTVVDQIARRLLKDLE